MSTENAALNPQGENNSLDSGTPFNSVKVVTADEEYIRVFKAGEQPIPITQLPNLGVESQEEIDRDPNAGSDDQQQQQQEGDDPINTDSQSDAGEGDSDEPTLYYFIQEELKKDGFLPEDVEFDKKVDGMTVYKAFTEKLKADSEPVIRQEIHQALLDDGYSPDDLVIARAIRQGVDYRLLSDATRFQTFATLPDTVDDTDKVQVVTQMYRDRQFNDDEIKAQIKITEEQDLLDTKFAEAKKYFGGKYNTFVEAENQRVEQRKQAAIDNAKKAVELINKVVTSREIRGESLTPAQAKEFEAALKQESHLVDVNGVKYRATEFQKFYTDFQNDDELKLLVFKMFKFRNNDKEAVKTEAKKEVEREFLSGYKQTKVKDARVEKTKEVAEHSNNQNANGRTFFYG